MLALSIRQPYAEQILRGGKTIEYRSRPTRVIGRRFYIYASKTPIRNPQSKIQNPPLPVGVIVGTARISRCTGGKGDFHWHLIDVKRLKRPRKPSRHPQPVWFRPF